MRTRYWVAGLLATAMFAVVQAQPGMFGFGGGGGPNFLVINKAIQEELKMTEEQIAKINEWSKEFFQTAAEIRKEHGIEFKFGKGGGGFGFGKLTDEDKAKLEKATAAINNEAYKQLGDILNKDQINRLKQIERQLLGVNAFTNSEIVEALKLTDSQKATVKGVISDLQTERRELMADLGFGKGGGFGKGKFDPEALKDMQKRFQEVQTKLNKVEEEAINKILDVLDDNQKRTWKELVGAPFDRSRLVRAFGNNFGKGKFKKKD
jgi:diaminopimelate decarboxylase